VFGWDDLGPDIKDWAASSRKKSVYRIDALDNAEGSQRQPAHPPDHKSTQTLKISEIWQEQTYFFKKQHANT